MRGDFSVFCEAQQFAAQKLLELRDKWGLMGVPGSMFIFQYEPRAYNKAGSHISVYILLIHIAPPLQKKPKQNKCQQKKAQLDPTQSLEKPEGDTSCYNFFYKPYEQRLRCIFDTPFQTSPCEVIKQVCLSDNKLISAPVPNVTDCVFFCNCL